MKKIIAIALAASAAIAEASIPMGICITNITATATGFEVDWVTDQPPPYRAAVHIPAEVGIIRTRPVEYVDTYLCHAVIPGRFYDVAVFFASLQAKSALVPAVTHSQDETDRVGQLCNGSQTQACKDDRWHSTVV